MFRWVYVFIPNVIIPTTAIPTSICPTKPCILDWGEGGTGWLELVGIGVIGIMTFGIKMWYHLDVLHPWSTCVLAGELELSSTIHFSITLPFSHDNDKVIIILYHMWLHQFGNHLKADLLEQEQPGFEPRTFGFKTDSSTIKPSHLFGKGIFLWFEYWFIAWLRHCVLCPFFTD